MTALPPRPGHPAFPSGALRRALASVSLLCLAGCHHRDVVDTTLDWYHQYQGGLIAQQRPPPPGLSGPYPKVGLTPTAGPTLPSPELRQSITSNLITARNLSLRTQAQTGTLTPVIPPPPGQKNAPAAQPASTDTAKNDTSAGGTPSPALPAGSMGAVLDAAESTPASPPPTSPSPAPVKTDKTATKTPQTDNEPEVALPDFKENKAPVTTPQPIPPIPYAPPPAPSISGVSVPADASIPDMAMPDYDLAQHEGDLIRFQPGSDQIAPGQENVLDRLANTRGNATLFLHCSGEAVSMSPADQTQAVELGLLRGRTLTEALQKRGVPSTFIHVDSAAFGPAARVSKTG